MGRQTAKIYKETIPIGWIKATIGETCQKPQYGWTTSASKQGTVKLLRTTDIASGIINWKTVPYCKTVPHNLSKYLLQKNDIVISRAGSVGFSYLVDNVENTLFASYLIRFKTYINPHFLYYFLQSNIYWNAIYEKKAGIALANVNATKIKSIQLCIPPLNEQKRIVSKIESIFSKINMVEVSLKTVQILTKQLRQAVLKLAFEGRLIPQDRNNTSAKYLLKNTTDWKDDGKLPVGWIKTNMRSCSTIVLGLSPPSSTYNTRKNGLPFFQGKADFGQTHPTVRIWCTKPKRIVEKDTLLLSVRAPVGSLNISTERSAIGRGLAGIKPLDKMSTKFFFYLLQDKRAELEQSGTGTTFTAIRGKDIRELGISLPPLNEQKRIVVKIEFILDHIDTIDAHVTKLLSTLATMRKSVLKLAFEGRLVPQDPRDESAHMLRERTGSAKYA